MPVPRSRRITDHTTRDPQSPIDIKTIHAGSGLYRTARARDDQSGAVAQRAHEVNGTASGGEYGAHARQLDARMAREHGAVGTPVADRLASFGQVRGLAFGNYSEASPDVHSLIDLAAAKLARAHWRSSGARNEAEAKGVWVACCRRRVGIAVARAYARFRLRRAIFVGVPRAVLDDGTPRGLAAMAAAANGMAAHAAVDLHALYAHQVTVRVNAD